MNYLGFSPNTAHDLQETWTKFHEDNLDRPDAKYLHFCHSQGAIHTKNALRNSPQEVRDRVTVVAIAPATVIPRELCNESYNYASKSDVVHFGELIVPGFFDTSETGVSKPMEMILEHRDQLILLDPHPDATGIDHGFQSPTFEDPIENHILQHIKEEMEK